MITMTFGLSLVLLVISLSLKTVLLSLRVLLKTAEMSVKAVGKVGKKVADDTGVSDSVAVKAVRTTGAVAGKAVRTVQKTGKAAVGTAKTAGKVAVKTAKVTKKVGQLSIKALKLAIRAIQGIINVIHAVVTFLLSLGVVGIVILVIIVLFLVAAVAGALLSISTVPGGGFVVGGANTGGLGTPILGGGTTGIYSPGGVNPGQVSGPSSPGVVTPGNTQALYDACKVMGNWYINNVKKYSAPSITYFTCDLLNGDKVGDSCVLFASAYIAYVTGKPYSSVKQAGAKTVYGGVDNWQAAGFKMYTTDEIGGAEGLLPGDILICSDLKDSCSKGGHAEVYLGPGESFGWGQVQTKFPSSKAVMTTKVCTHGLKYIQAGTRGHIYGRVYRYTGG